MFFHNVVQWVLFSINDQYLQFLTTLLAQGFFPCDSWCILSKHDSVSVSPQMHFPSGCLPTSARPCFSALWPSLSLVIPILSFLPILIFDVCCCFSIWLSILSLDILFVSLEYIRLWYFFLVNIEVNFLRNCPVSVIICRSVGVLFVC